MSLNAKRLVAAVALSVAAGSSFAAITAGDAVLFAYDSVSGKTLVVDLGATTSVFSNTATLNLATDPNWASFYVAADAASISWDILAATGSANSSKLYITSTAAVNSPSATLTTANTAIATMATNMTGMYTNTSAASGASFIETTATAADSYAFLSTDIVLSPTAYTTSGTLGQSLFLGQLSNGTLGKWSGTGFTPTASLSSTGALTVSAVPEPGTWAMMIAGMLTIGAVARRRNDA